MDGLFVILFYLFKSIRVSLKPFLFENIRLLNVLNKIVLVIFYYKKYLPLLCMSKVIVPLKYTSMLFGSIVIVNGRKEGTVLTTTGGSLLPHLPQWSDTGFAGGFKLCELNSPFPSQTLAAVSFSRFT